MCGADGAETVTVSPISNFLKAAATEVKIMFNDARAEGLALFVREGYRTTEEQQKIMDEKINEYEKQGYSAKEAKKESRNMLQFPIQANTN